MIKACVIGVGRMGSQHARCLAEIDEACLLAVADSEKPRAETVAQRFGCHAYSDYREMLAVERPEAVIAAVPTYLHAAVAREVIEHGCHLLVEKPLADTPAAARQIVQAAQNRPVSLAVGHIERFNPAVRKLREITTAGVLGHILSVSAKRVGLPSPHLDDTNVVIDLAVHDLDVISFLLGGRPQVVSAVTGRLIGGPHEDYADILLITENVPCVVQVNWVTPVKIRTLAVVGTLGYASLNYITQSVTLYRRQPVESMASYQELVARYGEAEGETVPTSGEEPLKAELRAFVNAIVNGAAPEASGQDGLLAVELAHEILSCARQVEAR